MLRCLKVKLSMKATKISGAICDAKELILAAFLNLMRVCCVLWGWVSSMQAKSPDEDAGGRAQEADNPEEEGGEAEIPGSFGWMEVYGEK